MMDSKAYKEGYQAWLDGKPYDSNPYPFVEEEESEHKDYVSGWFDARDDNVEGIND